MPQGWMATRIPALIFDGIVEIGCLFFLYFPLGIERLSYMIDWLFRWVSVTVNADQENEYPRLAKCN